MKGSVLYYGMPPEFLLLEHLALTINLFTLRRYYAETLQLLADECDSGTRDPETDFRNLRLLFKKTALKLFPRELY